MTTTTTTGHTLTVDLRHFTLRIEGDLTSAQDIPDAEIDAVCAAAGMRCTYEPVDAGEYRVERVWSAEDRATLVAAAAKLASDHARSPEVVDAGGPSPDDAGDFERVVLRSALADAGLPSTDVDCEQLRFELRRALAALAEVAS